MVNFQKKKKENKTKKNIYKCELVHNVSNTAKLLKLPVVFFIAERKTSRRYTCFVSFDVHSRVFFIHFVRVVLHDLKCCRFYLPGSNNFNEYYHESELAIVCGGRDALIGNALDVNKANATNSIPKMCLIYDGITSFDVAVARQNEHMNWK